MNDGYPQYELLAKYLDPQFGNIYEYNLPDGGQVGFNIQRWTPELRQTITKYLLHHCPANVFAELCSPERDDKAEPRSREAAVDDLLDTSEPWELAVKVHDAAVAAVPTLNQLLGGMTDWPSEDARADTIAWLERHADSQAVYETALASQKATLKQLDRTARPDDLVRLLTPPQLLTAWENAVGSTPTDLTDAEWRLLVPHFPWRRNAGGHEGIRPLSEQELTRRRNFLNGLRYKFLGGNDWSQIPDRYGGSAAYQTWYYYCRRGLFAALRDGIKDNPDAADLVDWLDRMNVKPRRSPRWARR
ncbi:transposase [Nocardia sp. NPDC003482]